MDAYATIALRTGGRNDAEHRQFSMHRCKQSAPLVCMISISSWSRDMAEDTRLSSWYSTIFMVGASTSKVQALHNKP